MFPISEPKITGPFLKGDRRYSLPSTTLANLGQATTSVPEPRPLKKPKWSNPHQIFGEVGRGVGRCGMKMAGGCHPPNWSRASQSKCAKSCQDRHPRGSYWNAWVDLHKTHRGPFPHQGAPTLKMVSPYLCPPWSSMAWSKCAKSHQDRHPRGSYWNAWVNLCKTHRGPFPHQGAPNLKMVSPYLCLPQSIAAWSKCAKSCLEQPRVNVPKHIKTDIPGLATRMLGSISAKLPGNLSHTKVHLP